jgi:putative ABC transport system permease protein
MSPLARLALRTVPSSWRDTIARDLADEAARNGSGDGWIARQAIGVGIRLWWTIGGGSLMFDVRYAIRSLWHSRWFAVGAALTFALGIGVNLAIFAAVDRLLFRSLPVPSSRELVLLRVCDPASGRCGTSFPDAVVRESGRLTTLGEMAVISFSNSYQATPIPGEAPPIRLMEATPNLLRTLGVKLAAGRDISDEEARDKTTVALLTYESWERRYQRDPSAIGRRIGTAAKPVVIIGVLPHGFVSPSWSVIDPDWDGYVLSTDTSVMAPIARLRPGQTLESAQAEVSALVTALGRQVLSANAKPNTPLPFIKVDRLETKVFERFTQYAWLVVGAAGLVLFMACANLSGLLLARGRSRERDAALRTALGASARRVMFASLIETAIVCAGGALVAMVVLGWSSRGLAAIVPAIFARYMEHVTDLRIVAITLGVSAICAMIAGLWPGARAARVDAITILQRTGGGHRPRLRGGRSLLAVQAALGMVLVLGAVTAVRSFAVLATEDVGYDAQDLYLVRASNRAPQAEQLSQYASMMDVTATMPGVVGTGGSDSVITNGARPMRALAPDRSIPGGRFEVSAGYFQTLRSRLIAGREFTREEVEARVPVAMLSPEGLAAVWPGVRAEAAVNRVLALAGDTPRTIVGIAPRLFHNARGETAEPALYVPLGTEPRFYSEWVMRMSPGVAPPTSAIRERIVALTGAARVEVQSVSGALEPSLKEPRLRAILLGALGGCALLLAAAGLYALAAFEVSLRRYEMGVRLTLGASTRRIQRQVILGAVRPVVTGALGGIVLAWWAGKFLQTFLYQVDARDPWTLALVALMLVVTAAAAAWLPARRASRVDPAVVLRAQ